MPWQLTSLARWLQRAGLCVLLLLLPVSKAAIEISFALLLTGWALQHGPSGFRSSAWRSGRGKRGLAAVAVFFLACAVSVMASFHPELGSRALFSKVLEYLLLLVIAADTVRSDKRLASLAPGLLMVSAFMVAADSIAQEFLRRDPLRGHELFIYGRMTGPYENPGDLAAYLLVVIPFVAMQLAAAGGRTRVAVAALLALLVGCMIRVDSQGAWFGLLGSLPVLALAERRLRIVLAVCGGLFVLAAGWWVYANGRLEQVLTFSEVGMQDRRVMWQAGWRMFVDRPWFGHGLNTFMQNYLDYWVGGERMPRYAHNCYLQMAAETGVVGLAAFVAVLGWLGAFWARGLRLIDRSDPRRWTVLGLASGLAGFALQAFVDTSFYSLRQAALFWTLAGLATGLTLAASDAHPDHPY
jgi:putative inorganic carbon (HCO3(-)) transporter